jgi:hypothetical protein
LCYWPRPVSDCNPPVVSHIAEITGVSHWTSLFFFSLQYWGLNLSWLNCNSLDLHLLSRWDKRQATTPNCRFIFETRSHYGFPFMILLPQTPKCLGLQACMSIP